jgi:hypothetical protein
MLRRKLESPLAQILSQGQEGGQTRDLRHTKNGMLDGAMPTKVSVRDLAMLTAGLAKEVEDVNQ